MKRGVFNKTPLSTLILACSGGPDSVFLAHYLMYKKQFQNFNVILAYFNHEWRKEAEQELLFCKNLAAQFGFTFQTRTASEQKAQTITKYNGSKEAEARELRYAFLYDLKDQYCADFIVLGHHQDDQMETFFIRMIRGTSLSGLCAMSMIDGCLLRPLLSLSKTEIVRCLGSCQIPYCIDVSNEDEQYLRNRVRKKLIPALRDIDNRSVQNIAKLIQRLQNAESCLEQITQDIFEQIVMKKDGVLYLVIPELIKLPQELQYRILLQFFVLNRIAMTFSESLFREVLRFLRNTKSNTHTISSDFVLKKECNSMRIFNQKMNSVP